MEPFPEKTREHLESERHRVNEEIGNPPTHIAGCDVQFNYLKRRAGEDRSGIGLVECRARNVDEELATNYTNNTNCSYS